jgi:hypothetical protein
MLKYPALLERMFQWEPEMREAFTEQWNEARKDDKNNKVKDTRPLLTEKDADTQQKQISDRWDNKFVNKLERQLRFVELLSLLEESSEARKAFIGKWNEKYGTCGYALDENLAPVAQVARIENWKQCTHEKHELSDIKNWFRNWLSRLDYLKNFMAQWSKEDQKKFIDEWNKNHKEDKQIAGKELFEQFVNIVERHIGKEVEDKIRYTESSKRLNAILEKRLENKAKLMKYLRCIRPISILAYADCINEKQEQDLAKAGWNVRPYIKGGKPYQKGGRNVVEIKYNDLRSQFAWNKEEIKDVFNPVREEDEDKRREQAEAFMVASDVFKDPAGRFFGDKVTKLYSFEKDASVAFGGEKTKEKSKDKNAKLLFDHEEKLEARQVWGETGMQNGLSDIDDPANKKEGAFRFNPKDGLRS